MVIFWSPSLLFLCLLLRLLFPFVVRETVHLLWFVHLGHLNVVVVLSSFTLPSCSFLVYADTATPPNTSRPRRETELVRYEDAIPVASFSNTPCTDLDLLVDDRTLMDINDLGDLKCDDLFRYTLYELVAIRDSFGGPDLAFSSDVAFSSLEDVQDVSGLEEGPTDITPMDAPARSARPVSVSDDYINVLRYDVSISGQEYTLLLPPKYVDSFYVDSRGRLFNVPADTIQGRLVDGNSNPYAQTGKFVYPTPCLGNNFYSIREYGSPNYVRECHWSAGRLQYRDTYVNIQVSQYHYVFEVSDTFTYIVIVLIGGCLIYLWRKSSR